LSALRPGTSLKTVRLCATHSSSANAPYWTCALDSEAEKDISTEKKDSLVKMAGNIGKSVRLYNYTRTLKSKSEYATKMNRLSNQIFGEIKRPTSYESMKIVQRLSREPFECMEVHKTYYPAVEETTELMRLLRDYGLYRNEHEDFKEEMLRQRQLRGKARIRSKWKDGVKPEKIVDLRYDD